MKAILFVTSLGCLACLLPISAGAQRVIIDDFPTTTLHPAWMQAIPTDPIGTNITSAAAHTGPYGLELYTMRTGWLYRDDSQAHAQQGSIMSCWSQLNAAMWTRNYMGFGATAAGTYSLVLGDNTNTLIIQKNVAYSYAELAAVPFTFINRYWYYLEVVWEIGGVITGNLYDSDGVTLLASVAAVDNTFTSGGVAARTFGDVADPGYWDTFERRYIYVPVQKTSWGALKTMFR